MRQLSDDLHMAIDFLLTWGRDRSDEGILMALIGLLTADGITPPSRDELLAEIQAQRQARSSHDRRT